MGEPTPPTPPSGDCPDCLADMPVFIYGRVTFPLAERVFEGLLPKIYDNAAWIFLNATWCVGEDNHVTLMAWGGVVSPKVYSCASAGYNCWPIVSCNDYTPEGVLIAILEIWAVI